MSNCAKCDGGFTGGLIAVCNICNDLFHVSTSPADNCSGLTSTEIRVLELRRKEPLLFYKCSVCKEKGKENPFANVLHELRNKLDVIQDIVSDFNMFKTSTLPSIQSSLDTLTDNYKNLNDKVKSLQEICKSVNESDDLVASNSNFNSKDVNVFHDIKEYNLRLNKKNNIIIFKATECLVNNKFNLEADVQNIIKILNIFDLQTKLDSNKISRIGKFATDKCRPVLVKFDVRSDATKVISNWQSLPRNLYVSFDYTNDQRSKYKRLKDEASNFNTNNKESGVFKVVRYKDGEPFLAVKNKVDKSNKDNISQSASSNINNHLN